MRSRAILLALAAFLLTTADVQATPIVGSLGFIDASGDTLADGSRTGDLNTATTFTFGNLTSTSGSGIFADWPLLQSFGTVSFNSDDISSPIFELTFGNSLFGTFTSGSFFLLNDSPSALSFNRGGLWTPGTFFSDLTGPIGAYITFSFTQYPAHTGDVVFSATFTVPPPPPPVPEPSSFALCLLGLAGLVVTYRLRARRP